MTELTSENIENLRAKFRHFIECQRPYAMPVDAVVFVDEKVSKGLNASPIHFHVSASEHFVDVSNRFADDRELVKDRVLKRARFNACISVG